MQKCLSPQICFRHEIVLIMLKVIPSTACRSRFIKKIFLVQQLSVFDFFLRSCYKRVTNSDYRKKWRKLKLFVVFFFRLFQLPKSCFKQKGIYLHWKYRYIFRKDISHLMIFDSYHCSESSRSSQILQTSYVYLWIFIYDAESLIWNTYAKRVIA